MATTKIANQSINFPTAKNVGIATKIEFLYCLACDILSKQLLGVSILRSKMADQKVFRSNGNIGFWFQRGLSFPKMYLVTTLHKTRAKMHSNPDYEVKQDLTRLASKQQLRWLLTRKPLDYRNSACTHRSVGLARYNYNAHNQLTIYSMHAWPNLE